MLETFRQNQEHLTSLRSLASPIREQHMALSTANAYLDRQEEALDVKKASGILSLVDYERDKALFLTLKKGLQNPLADHKESFEDYYSVLEEIFVKEQDALSDLEHAILASLALAYELEEKALPDELPVLSLTTDLTKQKTAAEFLSRFPNLPFHRWCSRLLFGSREAALKEEIYALQKEENLS